MDIKNLKAELLRQMKDREKGNLYHWTQTNFAYHSNRMEGSRITPDQTEMIFEDQTFLVEQNEPVRLDDLVEVQNHFRLFDEMLRLLNEPLSWEMILEMHVILKRGTSDEEKPWLGADQFKTVSNQIGMINPVSTTPPEQVEAGLAQLLEEYHRVGHPSFPDLLDFHIRFERIHPFSDGNGRIGRIILFRECLRHNMCPFIILDQNRAFYIRGLQEFDREPGYLRDTCLLAQDQYLAAAEQFLASIQSRNQ